MNRGALWRALYIRLQPYFNDKYPPLRDIAWPSDFHGVKYIVTGVLPTLMQVLSYYN